MIYTMRMACFLFVLLGITACQTTTKKTDTVNQEHASKLDATKLKAEKIQLSVENSLLQAQKLRLSELNRTLKKEVQEKTVLVEELKNKNIKVTFLNSILFPSGSYTLSKSGLHSIMKLKGIIKKHVEKGGIVRVIGHTDNVPVNKSSLAYKDNWDLSSYRAASVVRVLIWGLHLDPNAFRVEGHASTEPRFPNTTKQGRAQNRRIEILLTSK